MKDMDRLRHGATLLECIVAASILSVAMGTVTMGVFRIGRIWADAGHYRIALQEVSNHLEILSQLPPDQIQASIESLAVSPALGQSLVESKFSGELIQDEFGDRVKLTLTWGDDRKTRPIHMTAWLAGPMTEDTP